MTTFNSEIPIEKHPLQPFLPKEAKILMLGSFPPQKKRWSMDFFYPNLNNDMWRILGLLFHNDKLHFCTSDNQSFNKDLIIDFLIDNRIAIYDMATTIKRLKNNASDQYLEVVKATNIKKLLDQIPHCNTLVTTGKKATEILQTQFNVKEPKIGFFKPFKYKNRELRLYRMPSSSRAYPQTIEKKAEKYKVMFQDIGLL